MSAERWLLIVGFLGQPALATKKVLAQLRQPAEMRAPL
jgi:hypothetical protein